jgi:hypothetical protein
LGGYPLHEITRDYADFTLAELAALREDINVNGQRVPVTIWRGQIVEGRHRAIVCAELGLKLITHDISEMTEEAMRAYVKSLNQHRRSRTAPLTNEEKRARVEAALIADPKRSDRAIAEETGFSHPFVSSIRKDLEARGVVTLPPPKDRKSRTGKTGEGAKRGKREISHTSSAGLGDAQPIIDVPADDAAARSSSSQAAATVIAAGDARANPQASSIEPAKADDLSPPSERCEPESPTPSEDQPDQPDTAVIVKPYRSRAAQAAEQRVIGEKLKHGMAAQIERKAKELSCTEHAGLVDGLNILITAMKQRGIGEKDLRLLLAAKPDFDHVDLRDLIKGLEDLAVAWKVQDRRDATQPTRH